MPSRALFFVVLLWGCQTANPEKSAPIEPQATDDPPGVHGMLVLGTEATYLSLLPKSDMPIDHQVILKVNFSKSGLNIHDLYKRDRDRANADVYTLVPEPFVLSEIFPPPNTAPARRWFRGTLYRGHFERGGSPMVANISVEIERVVLARNLKQTQENPSLTYFLFGNEAELFAAHWGEAKAGFEHIISVRILEGILSKNQAAMARRGSKLSFEATNLTDHALTAAEGIVGSLALPTETMPIEFEVLRSKYFEIRELSL